MVIEAADLSAVGRLEFAAQEFKKVILKGGQVRGKEFSGCTFVKCSFAETTFLECRFSECVFRACDLSLANLKSSSFSAVRFEDCQALGVDWTQTTWADSPVRLNRPVDFLRCALNHATFMGLNMKKIVLSHCSAHDVSFEEANLAQADCSCTDFAGSRFMHTDLSGADFSGATNYTIAAHLNTLKKTRFSLPEAMSLLYGLDIILTE